MGFEPVLLKKFWDELCNNQLRRISILFLIAKKKLLKRVDIYLVLINFII